MFIYSDSPHWKDYIEENILPKLGSRCVTFKWSKRKWINIGDKLDNAIFYNWGGYTDFNPIAIIYIGFFNIKTVRFYKAFRDSKHGKDKLLKDRLEELSNIVGIKFG
ncbi:MAG TPA: hypothetical protein VLB82_12675 [Thermodesulfobacteriota bacterium]|nr:hypothetical protein [Thermodesulfobacteriota bacterium]